MAISVIQEACEFAPDGSRGDIVIESDFEKGHFHRAITELAEGMEARNLALKYALHRGVSAARINGNPVGPYPINDKKVPLDLVKDAEGKPLPQTDPMMQPFRYRISVPVHRSINS